MRTPAYAPEEGEHYTGAWAEAHRAFHRTLLEACGNRALLETFDRLWTASELARRWSAHRDPGRDGAEEHRRLEEAALARDADTAAEVLVRHLTLTAAALTDDSGRAVQSGRSGSARGPEGDACDVRSGQVDGGEGRRRADG